MRPPQIWTTPLRLFILLALINAGAFIVALFAQHVLGMAPCAWCILQRIIVLMIVISASLGALFSLRHWLWLSRLAAALLVFLGGAGITAAWHQYSVAAHSFSCAQSFADRFIQFLGLEQLLPSVFGIYANCMQAQSNWLGLDFALWSLGLFVIVTLGALLILWRLAR